MTRRQGRIRRAALAGATVTALWPHLAGAAGDPARGRALYLERCALCHGEQGQGWDWGRKVETPPVPVPDLAQVATRRSDDFLFEIVKHGGEAVGRTRFMPPFGFQLSDADVWDVVAYVRSLGRRP
ncbi:MAG TPA: cytochrome c [Methylomirabilota bacterium]|jgi:mono/diheme cytochrome c family protein|nr:cytochrome c [Methylomirabilota bacterium]